MRRRKSTTTRGRKSGRNWSCESHANYVIIFNYFTSPCSPRSHLRWHIINTIDVTYIINNAGDNRQEGPPRQQSRQASGLKAWLRPLPSRRSHPCIRLRNCPQGGKCFHSHQQTASEESRHLRGRHRLRESAEGEGGVMQHRSVADQ